MRNCTINRTIAAPRSAVWAVLADYPNIDEWNKGVTASEAVGDKVEGVGAQRHCTLTPGGSMLETVTEWTPESTMVVALSDIQKVPLKSSEMTFTLADGGETTEITMSYNFVPKGGLLAGLVTLMMRKPMQTGFNAFVDDLQVAAQAHAAA